MRQIFEPMSFEGWTRLLQALVPILVLFTVPAAAEIYHIAPAPTGSDTNDCLGPSTPCATFQRAVNLCPPGAYCGIVPAPGVYSQKTDIFFHKTINISGNCTDRSAVVVDDRINGVGQAGSIFQVQDHATLAISCVTLAAYANGSVGFASRQFAIGDADYVDFRQFRGGHGVTANETSKISLYSPGIYGDASRFVSAADLSQIAIGGTIRIGDGLTFEVAFLSAFSNSIVSVHASKIMGGEAMSGASYQCNDATIKTNVTLPGGDAPYVGTENCTFNAIHLNPEIKAIRSDIDERLGPEIKAIRSDIDERLGPEIKAIRSQINTLFRISIAVLTVLTIAAVLSAFYVWQQRRRWRLYQSGKLPITPLNRTRPIDWRE